MHSVDHGGGQAALLADPLLRHLGPRAQDLVHAPLVLPEGRERLVAVAADGTLEGRLARVAPLVRHQPVPALEHLLAEAALELRVLVLAHVHPQVGYAVGALPAQLALVLLALRVLHGPVPLHLGVRLEGQEADGAGGGLADALVDGLDVVPQALRLGVLLAAAVAEVVEGRVGVLLRQPLRPQVDLDVPLVLVLGPNSIVNILARKTT